jgi:hypothetical protein
MILYSYLMFVLVSVGVSLFRWRWGPFLMILVGMLQDPVRKLVPGAPGYLTLPAAAVWAATVLGAFVSESITWRNFREHYGELSGAIALFALSLIPAIIISATYAPGSWQITVIGLFIYGSLLVGMMVGEVFPQRHNDIPRFIGAYAVCGAIFVSGGILEKLGVSHATLGTAAMGYDWVTYRTGGAVHMLAGFFRSPDVLGWHAASVAMCSIICAMFYSGWRRAFWGALAAWGSIAALICNRRKMVIMIPVFAAIFALLHFRHGRSRQLGLILMIFLIVGGIGIESYRRSFSDEYTDRFYSDTAGTAGQRVVKHGIHAVIGTFNQAGFFGYGVGMATQGTQHIAVERPRVWQEGGPGKLMAELGIIGVIGFIFLSIAILRSMNRDLLRVASHSLYPVYAGLVAMLLANASAGVVSAQIFGDPFIAALLSFSMGLVLSSVRIPIRGTIPQRMRINQAPETPTKGLVMNNE